MIFRSLSPVRSDRCDPVRIGGCSNFGLRISDFGLRSGGGDAMRNSEFGMQNNNSSGAMRCGFPINRDRSPCELRKGTNRGRLQSTRASSLLISRILFRRTFEVLIAVNELGDGQAATEAPGTVGQLPCVPYKVPAYAECHVRYILRDFHAFDSNSLNQGCLSIPAKAYPGCLHSSLSRLNASFSSATAVFL